MAIPSLPFEKPIIELEERLRELKEFSEAHNIDVSAELADLKKKINETQKTIFSSLTPWDEVQLARHPQRPYTLDYIEKMCTGFTELHGDRLFRDDQAVVGGFAMLDSEKVMIIGTQKGRDVKSNVQRNFGMAHPEGYRKALRLMKQAEKFGRPVLCLVDTAGADVAAVTTQKLDAPNPRTFVGSGKAEEVAELARAHAADLVVFDESGAFRDCRMNHLYTAITRAAERIMVVM